MEKLSSNDKCLWTFWNSRSSREVVREAAAKGLFINSAHRYLEEKHNWDKKTTADYFTAEVFTWILQLLSRKHVHKAIHILKKINIPPQRHLFNVTRETLDKEIRDYVTDHFINKETAFQKEIGDEWTLFLKHYYLLKLLEDSFDFDGIAKQNNVFGCGKEMIVINSSDVKQLTIEGIETKTIEWKKKLTTYLFLDSFDFSIMGFLDSEYLWKILLERNMVILLRRWIALSNYKEKYLQYDTSMIDKNALCVDTLLLDSPEILRKVDDLFTHWTITNSMIDYVFDCQCFNFTKLCVYDALCAFGYVFESEKNDLKLILRRLSRTQNLHNIDKIFSKGDIQFRSHLNDMIVDFSVENNLYHVMTTCVDSELLMNRVEDIQKTETKNCLDLWLLFKAVQESKEVSHYPQMIYETCKYVSKSEISTYCSENYNIILAMMLFSDFELFKIFDENKSININGITLNWENSLSDVLPHLYAMYKNCKNDSLISVNDVTMYQLLSGYKGLDISKVFEFQLLVQNKKTLKDLCTVDIYSRDRKKYNSGEFPHFSNEKLSKKLGYRRNLNYLYYLRQNRPCMASQTLIVHHYQSFRRLNIKLLREACSQAHTMALKNWHDSIITSSCISFITMIGCDATRCRVHVDSARSIAFHLVNREGYTKGDSRKKVTEIVTQLIENKSGTCDEILETLENIYMSDEKFPFESSQSRNFGRTLTQWQTALKFAYFHKLPLPTKLLKKFASKNYWLPFFLFADVYKYPLRDMLNLTKDFTDIPLLQHMKQSIKNLNRRNRYLKNVEEEVVDENDFQNNLMMDDLWEVLAVCHGPEDPPAALIKASAAFHSPVPALLATCYEPDAVEVFWTQWIITSMRKVHAEQLLTDSIRDASDMNLTDNKLIEVIKVCIENGYYRTLCDSFSIFYKKSPLFDLLRFLVRTVYYLNFDKESVELLNMYKRSLNKYYSVVGKTDGSWLPRFMRPKFVQLVTSNLVTLSLCKGFDNIWHQKKFLRCLCEGGLSKYCTVSSLDFCSMVTLLDIGLEYNMPLDLGRLCSPNSKEAIKMYIDILVDKKHFDVATNFANITNQCKDDILISEWTHKYEMLLDDIKDTRLNDFAVLQFWTKCSYTLKENQVQPLKSVRFLKNHCDQLVSNLQKFYFLRLILIWFENMTEDIWPNWYGLREFIECDMWSLYLSCDEINNSHLLSIKNTYNYLLNLNIETFYNNCDFKDVPPTSTHVQFQYFLNEIIEESHVSKMSMDKIPLNEAQSEKWINCLESLLNMGLMGEAWRLNVMFVPNSSKYQHHNPIEVFETCLKLAEGTMTSQQLPTDVRAMVMPTTPLPPTLSSHLSETSFEDYVLLSGRQDDILENGSQTANSKDTDVASILDTVAAKTCYTLLKQISNYYKIAMQIDWSYEKILKFNGNALDLITKLSGRSRMPLAKLVFHTFDISSQNVMEYLCLEIVTAIISSHLTRTSGFRLKERFHYTVWGYPMHSDFEMFLNIRPDDNSILGHLLLEYLSAFRKLCKSQNVYNALTPDDPEEASQIDVMLEDYQNIEDDEVERVAGDTSIKQIDNQSIASTSTVTYNTSRRHLRERKNQSDVISCTNMHITTAVKTHMQLLLNSNNFTSKQVNVISIELLILAHECFSSVCDTEGIATVLRSTQTLTNYLRFASSWSLLVRLLTGIGRYTETAYIFQILKDANQFEYLLGQFESTFGCQEDKIENFKLGILDYLKKYCPGDTDSYCLVAIRFFMYFEAGEMKKKQANDMVIALRQMSLDSLKLLKKRQQNDWLIIDENESSRVLLQTAVHLYSDSSEFFAKGGYLNAAREMASMTQLCALQMSLLSKPPTRSILNITQEQMVTALEKYLNFMEGLVFAHAYEVFGGLWITRWREIVYQKVVRDKDEIFTRDIGLYRPDIAVFILERYDNEKSPGVSDSEVITELRSLFK